MSNEISILLVETDTYQQELFSLVLEEAGFIVNSVNTVAEAVNLVQGKKQFDIILSDLILPDASGIELMIMLNELNMAIPTILISSFRSSEIQLFAGKNNEELFNELRHSGFRGIIEKPSNSDDLVEEILKIICDHSMIDDEPDISAF